MEKKKLLLAILVLSVASICYAADETEEITLTTYYPAPFGEYDELIVRGNTYLAIDSGSVGIGTTNPQGVLDLQSTTSAFLPPRMTEAQRDNISSPPTGSVIYNTDDNELNYHNGTNWGSIVGGNIGGWHRSGSIVSGWNAKSGVTHDTWHEIDLSSIVGANPAFVYLKIAEAGTSSVLHLKPFDDNCTIESLKTYTPGGANAYSGSSISTVHFATGNDSPIFIATATGPNGKIYLGITRDGAPPATSTITIKVVGYVN